MFSPDTQDSLLASPQVMEQARQARDPRFDGRFFVAVSTTGIYCRPVCPVMLPKAENVRFYASAAAATSAGFRPCLRCRPESAPGSPAWAGTSTTVARGLKLIAEGALDEGSVNALSDRLGVTSRHLSRLFVQHLGAAPRTIAQTRRLQAAKTLLDQTTLPVTRIAMLAGYGSLRRFNAHCQEVYGRSPTQLRRSQPSLNDDQGISLMLRYRPPYDFGGVLRFLAMRGIPGVEQVDATSYRRHFQQDGKPGQVCVTHHPDADALVCRIDMENTPGLMGIVNRIRRLFDLNADPLEINQCLSRDPQLAPLVAENPGQRLPGAWDPFEIAVRAIVGQQVSVKGATTIMGRLARNYGTGIAGAGAYPGDDAGLRLERPFLFPTPAQLANLSPADLPMPGTRAGAIKQLAQQVDDGVINFRDHIDSSELIKSLLAIKGIGGWTARYVAMRALGDPDAFLHDDLVLARSANDVFGNLSPQALLERSAAWQPWRAYAGSHLWRRMAAVPRQKTQFKEPAR